VDPSGRPGVTSVTLSRVTDFVALGERWRRLEARAACSFFQSWTWTGCLAEDRFPDPVLVEATDGGETVALALFNRHRRPLRPATLLLGESGVAVMDRPYIEFNGVLAGVERKAELTRICLQAARGAGLVGGSLHTARRLVLSGIDDPTLAAAGRIGGALRVRRSQPAPYVDLARVRGEGGDYLDRRSANTRQQLRRSDRTYAERGALSLRRAEGVTEAHRFLDELAPLHQATWIARGEPGCFADPFFGRFHHALIERGMPRGEIDLLRIAAGSEPVGILYNFRFRRRMMAYQSGFDYPAGDRRRKPGLTCHHLAIRFAMAADLDIYDFLAGDSRYKLSLADDASMLHWVEVEPFWTGYGLWRTARSLLTGLADTR
jgi:CelD/BcsL family acetyltransferase involved in cellulose biosynthesis